MENEELRKILNKLSVPEPSNEVRSKTIQSAMAKFRLQAEKKKKQFKGFAWLNRLISKKPKGGFFMNRTIAISTAGIVVSIITFAIVFSPGIISQIRKNYAPVTRQEIQVPKEDYSAKPDESTIVTQIEQGKAESLHGAKKDAILSTKMEQEKAQPDLLKKAKTSDTDAPKTYIVSGGATDSNIAEPVEIGASSKSLSKLAPVTINQGVTPNELPVVAAAEKKEFTLEEITDSARIREENQQKAPIAMGAGDEARRITLHQDASTGVKFALEAPMKAKAEAEARLKAVEESLEAKRLSQPIGIEGIPAIVNPEYIGRDKFEDIKVNTIKLVSEEPVSTFSIDVDTASYAFVRRALNNGYLPQSDSIRIEELINYFDYDYPLPRDKTEPFKPTVAIFQTPWNANTKLLHIGIKGYDIVPEKKPNANLTFLIDVSGSMQSEDKLPLLKNSLRMLVDTLNPDDTVAITVYAGAAGTVLERTKASEKIKILAAIDQLQAGGSTAGGEGIKLAYSLAEASMDPKGLNRVILATDGDFNVGITDPDVLQDFVERKRKSGIYLSVLGFGQGNYNDELMQKLAQNGNGNAAYIDNLNEARKVLVDEATGTLFTIAKDVKIQVEFNPDMVSEYRLIGYETRQLNREDFKNDNVDAGDIGSGHSVTAIYEITPKGSDAQLIDDLRYGSKKDSEETKKSGNTSEYAFLKIRYKLPEEDSSREISTPIDKDNEYKKISDAPADSRFASAVAAFGQLLRGDSYINQFTYDDVIALASNAKKNDTFGYRAEFLNLVRLAKTASAMGDR